jgi:hypothetical protein
VYSLKRRLVVLSAFLSVLLLFSTFSVKANEIDFPAFPEPVEGKSSTHYLISFSPGTGLYYLLKPLDSQCVSVAYEGSKKVFRFSGPAITYYWEGGESGWVKSGEHNHKYGLVMSDDRIFLYSSFDLFYSDGELFFQRAPIKVSFLAQMKKIQMGATMKTVVYLIPLLMVLLASLIAFRKAWQWLSKVLRKA